MLWERQNARCAYCCKDLRALPYHIDHIIPHSRGGPNTLANYAIACIRCNVTKKDNPALDLVIRLLTR